jgi:hypothetical protein
MAASRLAIQTYSRNVQAPRRCPQHLLIDVINGTQNRNHRIDSFTRGRAA